MTIIATDGHTMAGDGRAMSGGDVVTRHHTSTVASPGIALPSYSTLCQAASPVLRRCDTSVFIRALAEAEANRLERLSRRKVAAKRREAISEFRQQHRAPMLIYHWDETEKMLFAIQFPGVAL